MLAAAIRLGGRVLFSVILTRSLHHAAAVFHHLHHGSHVVAHHSSCPMGAQIWSRVFLGAETANGNINEPAPASRASFLPALFIGALLRDSLFGCAGPKVTGSRQRDRYRIAVVSEAGVVPFRKPLGRGAEFSLSLRGQAACMRVFVVEIITNDYDDINDADSRPDVRLGKAILGCILAFTH